MSLRIITRNATDSTISRMLLRRVDNASASDFFKRSGIVRRELGAMRKYLLCIAFEIYKSITDKSVGEARKPVCQGVSLQDIQTILVVHQIARSQR
jgi:hypothetical protein